MLIEPSANNAIEIRLDDNSIMKMHHTLTEGRDHLYITNRGGLQIDIREGLNWKTIATETIIRITVAHVG